MKHAGEFINSFCSMPTQKLSVEFIRDAQNNFVEYLDSFMIPA